ncbi:MAG TPA: TolC family protein [Planctomycetaceae bacterium]|nr:TolC family protein [Planctomycetaceae bacterium]
MQGCRQDATGGRLRPQAQSQEIVTLRESRWRMPVVRAAPRAGILALALIGSGCTNLGEWVQNGFKVGPNYAPPAAPVADEWIEPADAHVVKNVPAQDRAWWTAFNDPVLNRLMDTAYRQNLDLRAAAARIMEARARQGVAVGNLFPQSQTALAAYAHAQISKNLGLPLPSTLNVWADGFNASWELDFWGRLRRSIEAADANLEAATEGYGQSLVLLFSEVATNYVQLRTFEQRLQFARENVEIQERSLAIAQARFDQGATTELDVRQAKSTLAQTKSTIPPLEAGRRQAANQLCILLGMPVHDLANRLQPGPIPGAPPEIAVGIPADLLRRRPDVRQAERQVAAQSAQIGIAQADLYPRLGVSGFLGYAANDLRTAFDGSSFMAFVLPTLQWNILNYGRIVNNVRAQDAALEAIELNYQQTVLTAGREVEDALVQFIQAQRQARHLAESVAQAQRAVELVLDQFEGGITDYNRVFTNQAQLVTQQDQLGTAQGNIALYLIQVYRAMGGGWESFCAGEGMPNLVDAPPSAEPTGDSTGRQRVYDKIGPSQDQ